MNKKNPKLKILFFIFSLNIIVSIIYLLNHYYLQYKNETLYKELQSQVTQTQVILPTPKASSKLTHSPSPSQEPLPETSHLNIDFDALKNLNNDIYAWIYIPNTEINYPILQHPEDDSYYLNHNLDGQKGYPGCIYSEKYNSIDFSDPVTVLYGHNMNNGTMFGALLKYEDTHFLDENYRLSIYTPKHFFEYEIVLVAEYDNIHILKNFNFLEKEGKTLFLKSVLNESQKVLTKDLDVHSTSQLLILSTCLNTNPSKRLLIIAQKL